MVKQNKRIHLIRHGQAEHNIPPFSHDIPDPPLTTSGHSQALSIHVPTIPTPEKLLSHYPSSPHGSPPPPIIFISSPLLRPMQTALLAFSNHLRAVAKLNAPLSSPNGPPATSSISSNSEANIDDSLPTSPLTSTPSRSSQYPFLPPHKALLLLPQAQETGPNPCDVGTTVENLKLKLREWLRVMEDEKSMAGMKELEEIVEWSLVEEAEAQAHKGNVNGETNSSGSPWGEGWLSKKGFWSWHDKPLKERARWVRRWLREFQFQFLQEGTTDEEVTVDIVLVAHHGILEYISHGWHINLIWPNCEWRTYSFLTSVPTTPSPLPPLPLPEPITDTASDLSPVEKSATPPFLLTQSDIQHYAPLQRIDGKGEDQNAPKGLKGDELNMALLGAAN